MPHHSVTLNYGPDGFKPEPDPVKVKQNDTISFKLGTAPPGSQFQVTLKGGNLFSATEVTDSQTRIQVRQAASSKYHCKLLDANKHLVAESTETVPGGGIEPDTGN